MDTNTLSVHLPAPNQKENLTGKQLRSSKVLKTSRPLLGNIVNRAPQNKTEDSKSKEKVPFGIDEKRVQDFPLLPPGVPNIDKEDENQPQLCAEYVPFTYSYLRQLEQEQPIKKEFLKNCHVNGKMRAVLIDWLVEVHHQFKLLQETFYMTVFIIDRYLTLDGMSVKRGKFQLLGVAAMFVASKVEEMYAPEIGDFVYITDNAFTAAEIRHMELKILNVLNFALGRPLPLHFLRRNSKAGDVDILQHTLAKYFTELVQVEYDFAHLPPSQVAASSLYLALVLLTPDCTVKEIWSSTLEYYSSYSSQQLLPTVCKMAAAVLKTNEGGKLKSVHTKYSAKKLLKVAELPELKGELVSTLAAKHLNSLR